MDGFLQSVTIEMIQLLLKDKSSLTIQNSHKPYEGKSVHVLPYNVHCQKSVLDSILLSAKAGKRLGCMITSQNLAVTVADHLKEIGIKVSIYHGDDLSINEDGEQMRETKKKELSDVNRYWAES